MAQKAALAMAAEIERIFHCIFFEKFNFFCLIEQEFDIDYSNPDALSNEDKAKVTVSVLKVIFLKSEIFKFF